MLQHIVILKEKSIRTSKAFKLISKEFFPAKVRIKNRERKQYVKSKAH